MPRLPGRRLGRRGRQNQSHRPLRRYRQLFLCGFRRHHRSTRPNTTSRRDSTDIVHFPLHYQPNVSCIAIIFIRFCLIVSRIHQHACAYLPAVGERYRRWCGSVDVVARPYLALRGKYDGGGFLHLHFALRYWAHSLRRKSSISFKAFDEVSWFSANFPHVSSVIWLHSIGYVLRWGRWSACIWNGKSSGVTRITRLSSSVYYGLRWWSAWVLGISNCRCLYSGCALTFHIFPWIFWVV